MIKITLAGVNHKTAPVDVREKIAYPKEHLSPAVRSLSREENVLECLILSTCNRVEILTITSNIHPDPEFFTRFLSRTHPALSSIPIRPHLYYKTDTEAVEHLFEVTASLDSMIVGEPQITGQVKDAFETCRQENTIGPYLNQIFQRAVSTAKRVRSETAISHLPVSISYAACQLARKIFQDMSNKSVLLLGGGDMAQLTARHMKKMGVRSLTVMTRDPEKGKLLAAEYEASYASMDTLEELMAEADMVICSTGADTYLLTAPIMEKAMERRGFRPLFLIDIAVPRNIDPGISRLSNTFLYNIDDLKSVVESNQKEREMEAYAAREIVRQEIAQFQKWRAERSAVPLIQALRRHTEKLQQSEFERFSRTLESLPDETRKQVMVLAQSLVNKMLHPTYQTLRNSSNLEEAWEWISRCYGLSPELLSQENISREDADLLGKKSSVLESPSSEFPLPGEQSC
ncbi:MAG: glutamyl-tRNA reductase [Leptospirillum sp. Group IV 'UBA BS']|nr:MAG: glutamyl-tRNA reductase [Leptospirillum sp. Group IV 'UBA BS']